MSALATSHDALLPRQDNRLGLGAALALLAHGGLVAALALGLNWRLPTADVVVSAELWSAVPQVAAPAPVEPAPAPPPPPPAPAPAPAPPPGPTAAELQAARDAEIALEKAQAQRRAQDEEEARRLKQRLEARRLAEAQEARRLQEAQEAKRLQEAQKAERAKAEQAREAKRQKDLAAQKEREKAAEAEAKAEAKAQAEQIAKLREENLKRMMGQAGATGSSTATGTAKADAAPSAGYGGRIKAAILPNIIQPDKERGNPVAEVEVRCAPDGSIVGRRISKPSGNPAWDETVLRAIDKTRQLPLDNGRIPPTMTLVFSQNETR